MDATFSLFKHFYLLYIVVLNICSTCLTSTGINIKTKQIEKTM
jgi:hypothetical protein